MLTVVFRYSTVPQVSAVGASLALVAATLIPSDPPTGRMLSGWYARAN